MASTPLFISGIDSTFSSTSTASLTSMSLMSLSVPKSSVPKSMISVVVVVGAWVVLWWNGCWMEWENEWDALNGCWNHPPAGGFNKFLKNPPNGPEWPDWPFFLKPRFISYVFLGYVKETRKLRKN